MTHRIVSRTLLGAVLVPGTLLLGAASAVAADLGVPRGNSYLPPVAPRLDIERWTGFYLGATLGGSFDSTRVTGAFGADTIAARGWNGTLLAGYNWQVGSGVFGLEADIGTGNVKGSRSNGIDSYTVGYDTIGSLRARAGLLLSPSFLAYATGGFAYTHSNISLAGGDSTRQWFTGWQLGAGTELKIDPRWSLRLEYIYTDLGAKTITHSGLVNSFDPSFHTVRAGVTYKF